MQASVTGSGIAARDCAKHVLKRMKPVGAGNLAILEIGSLCQPLWAFPWLNDYDTARSFFSRATYSKWDADQWLVCTNLY